MLIGYARVSTQDQNPDLQIDALRSAGCEEIYIDKASGANIKRPELTAALRHLREGDTLVLWKLDRLARSMRQLLDIMEELDRRGIAFRSLTETMDTGTAGGRLIFTVFGALAQFERSIIQERTTAGLAAARARGRKGGRPPALSAEDIAEAKALLSDPSITMAKVAKRLQVAESTLYRHFPGGRSAMEITREVQS